VKILTSRFKIPFSILNLGYLFRGFALHFIRDEPETPVEEQHSGFNTNAERFAVSGVRL